MGDREAVLRDRAHALAGRRRIESSTDTGRTLVVLVRSGAVFGLPIERVEEVALLPFGPLPGPHPVIIGVVHTRGRTLGLADPGPLLSRTTAPLRAETALAALVRCGEGVIALLVDQVVGTRTFATSELRSAGDERADGEPVQWVSTDGVLALDVDALLSRTRIRAMGVTGPGTPRSDPC